MIAIKHSITESFGFNMQEDFMAIIQPGRLNLTLVPKGETNLLLNGKKIAFMPPCIFLSSCYDKLELPRGGHLSAKTFSFHPAFVNKRITVEQITNAVFSDIADEHDRSLLCMLFLRDEPDARIIRLMPQMFLRISEWFDLAAMENEVRGDTCRPFRIRRCLMQILYALEEVIERQNESGIASGDAIANFVIDYIHTNYSRKISLDSLCKIVCVNRTTLNNIFKARTRRPPIDYLLHHRLNIACELLTYTKLSINRIAESTGFRYETYFIRQFVKKIGITPTQYRISEGYETLNNIESRIVDEF